VSDRSDWQDAGAWRLLDPAKESSQAVSDLSDWQDAGAWRLLDPCQHSSQAGTEPCER
jgi:hypothetical protein